MVVRPLAVSMKVTDFPLFLTSVVVKLSPSLGAIVATQSLPKEAVSAETEPGRSSIMSPPVLNAAVEPKVKWPRVLEYGGVVFVGARFSTRSA